MIRLTSICVLFHIHKVLINIKRFLRRLYSRRYTFLNQPENDNTNNKNRRVENNNLFLPMVTVILSVMISENTFVFVTNED